MATAWQKAFQRIFWKNRPNTSTPLGESKLLPMDAAIDEIDDRVVNLRTTKAEQSDLLLAFKDISFNNQTGVFTITKFNDTTITIDTDIEKIAVNFDYDDDPTSSHYQSLIITLDDGTVKYVDMSALLTQYEFTDTSTIHFTVGSNGSVSANVINGSITENHLASSVMATINQKTAQAGTYAEESEAWAKGTKDGTPVTSSDEQYHNNAKYFSEASEDFSEDSEAWAKGTRGGVDVPSTDPTYHNNAKYYAENATQTLDHLTDVEITSPVNKQSLVYDSTTQKWKNATSSGGHTIQDGDDTAYTQREILKFPDADVSDDSTNLKTVVNVMHDPMTLANFLDAQNLDDGIYPVTEDDNTVLSSDMVSHGNGTVEQAIDGKVDKSTKIAGFNIPICIEKNTSAETWMSVSFPVSVGDRVCWSGMSTANSGAFTVKVVGSVSGLISDEARDHVNYNSIQPIYNLDIHTDETLTITSYTNTATTFKHMNISVYKLDNQ